MLPKFTNIYIYHSYTNIWAPFPSMQHCTSISRKLGSKIARAVYQTFQVAFSFQVCLKTMLKGRRMEKSIYSWTSPMMMFVMYKTRSVESITNFTLEESLNIFIMQLNNALKDFYTFLSRVYSTSSPFRTEKCRGHWTDHNHFPRIHNEIWSWSAPDEHVFL